MEQEKKIILTVDTGQSEKSVKSLKQDIANLKDAILNLEKGTEEYNDAVEQLQTAQRELNEVQALTKETAVAMEGSYDALTHQMSLLKKEWKATGDEMRRAEIGRQIAEINAQLKAMDAEIGNYQRNVGNYVSHWEGMPDAANEIGESFAAAAASPKDFGVAMREMNDTIEPTKQKFESVSNIASGLASGFAAVQGAMGLLGIENENFERTMVKIQSAMALAQGIGGMKGLVEGIGKASVAFQGLGDKIKSVSKAMGATGWIAVIMAVITAITLLVSWIKKAKDNSEDLEKQLEKQNEMFSKMGSNVAGTVGKFKLLQNEYKNLKTEAEKKKWIDDNAQAFSSLGLAINDVNTANKTFLEDSDKIINALRLQAEAAALSSIYQEEYGKAYAEQRKIEQKALAYKAGYSPTASERAAAGLSNEGGDFRSTYHPAAIDESSAAGMWIQASEPQAGGTHSYTEYHSDVNAAGAAKLQEYAKQQVEQVWEEANAVMADYLAKQKEATEAAAGLGLGGNKGGGTKTPEQIRDELVAAAWDFSMQVLDEQIAALDDIEIEEEPKSVGYEYKDGDAEKRANIRIAQEERIANRQIELNNMAEQSEEERAAKEFEIRQALEQKKLDLLKKFREQALAEGDILGAEELAQQIADKEIEIEKAKYDEMYRLRAEYAAKTTNAISQASQITQGILEITQAAYEKDEEITEKEAKRIKGLQIAIATMNMLQGITSALSGVFTTHTGVWDIAMAAAQATAIATIGGMNIAKIKSTDFSGGSSAGSVTPNLGSYSSELPVNYTRNVTTASETDELNKATKVYVLESDIAEAMTKVSVRESESSF